MTTTRTHTLDDAPRPRRAPEQTVTVTGMARVEPGRQRAQGAALRSAGAAVVKVHPYRQSVGETVSTLTYVLEKARAAEDDWAAEVPIPPDGLSPKARVEEMRAQSELIAGEWGIRDNDGRVSAHIVFSLPNQDPRAEWDAARDAIRACFPNSPYVCALHNDKGNPHVHVVVRMRDYQGKKLRIGRETLYEYRQALARAGRERGIEVEARRYRVPTRLRDRAHVFSTAEPLGRVLDRQIAVINDFTESTPTQFRQACKTLDRHQRDLHDAQKHQLLRVAGKLEREPSLRPTARALTRLAFQAPSSDQIRARQRTRATTRSQATTRSESQTMSPPVATETAVQRARKAVQGAMLRYIKGTRLGQRIEWHHSYKQEREALRQDLRTLQDERKALRTQWKAISKDRERREERASVTGALVKNSAQARELQRQLKLQRKLRKPMSAKQKRQHHAKALKSYSRALRQELRALCTEHRALRCSYKAQGSERMDEARAALEAKAVRIKLHRYEIAHLAKLGKAVARNERGKLAESSRIIAALARSTGPDARLRAKDSSLELALRHARRENPGLDQSTPGAPMRWTSEKGRNLLAAQAHEKRRDALRAELADLRARHKTLRAQARASVPGDQRVAIEKARDEVCAQRADVRRELAAERKLRKPMTDKQARKQHAKALRQQARELRGEYKALRESMHEQRRALRTTERMLTPEQRDKAHRELRELATNATQCRQEIDQAGKLARAVARNERGSLAASSRMLGTLARSAPPSERLRARGETVRAQESAVREQHAMLRDERNALATAYRNTPDKKGAQALETRKALEDLDQRIKATRAELADLRKLGKAHRRSEESSLALVRRSLDRSRQSGHAIDVDKVLAPLRPATPLPARDQLGPALPGHVQRRQKAIEHALDKLVEPPTANQFAARRALWTLATHREQLTGAQRSRLGDQVTAWYQTAPASQEAGRFVEGCQRVALRIAGREGQTLVKESLTTPPRATTAPEPARVVPRAALVLNKHEIAEHARQRAEARAHAVRPRTEPAPRTATVQERAQVHLARAIATLGRFPEQASKQDRAHAAKAFERLHPYLSPQQRDTIRQHATRLATDPRHARLGKALERIAQAPARDHAPARAHAPARDRLIERTPPSPRR